MFKRFLLLAIPPVFLLLHVLRTPMVVPSFLLRPQVIACPGSQPDAQILYDMLRRHGTMIVPTEEALRLLRRNEFQSVDDLAAYLGDLPLSEAIDLPAALVRASALVPRYSRIILLLDRYPTAAEIRTIDDLQRRELPPITIQLPRIDYDPLFLAFSYTYGTRAGVLDFDLLFSPEVGEYRSVELSSGGKRLVATTPDGLEGGRGLQATLPLPASGDTLLEISLAGNREPLRRSLRIQTRGEEDPQILLISGKANSRSVLETLYRVKRVSMGEVLQENLAAYPLLVFDGVPLGALGSQLTAAITEIHKRKSASLFFVADSPLFGKKGDNPEVERILPVELSPRSLRYLPDLGILILLDVSASMMGEKLSLAKVSTLEMLKNLKDTDRVSILAFWDNFRFLHGFEEKRSLSSEIQLAPLIAQGGTDMYRALEKGLDALLSLDMEDRHVIVISDGNTKKGDFASLIERAYGRGITISTLGVGEEVNTDLLSRIAQETDGRYYRVLSLEEIPSIIFEDRKSIARSSFALDLFSIIDSGGAPAGEVSGMSLFTPKSGKPVVYQNQLDDPLLVAERNGRQLTVIFLSDLYGTYTKDFFSNPEVVRTVQAVLDPVLRRHQLTVRIAEAAGRMSVTVSGRDLVEPTLEVYRDNRVIQHRRMEAGIYRTYHSEFPASGPGFYTAILYSQGTPLIRVPLYYNAIMQGLPTDALLAWTAYRRRAFASLPAGNLFLVLFFLSSLLVTWWARNPKWLGSSIS
jgi:Mg-chelatase subunit ChlD